MHEVAELIQELCDAIKRNDDDVAIKRTARQIIWIFNKNGSPLGGGPRFNIMSDAMKPRHLQLIFDAGIKPHMLSSHLRHLHPLEFITSMNGKDTERYEMIKMIVENDDNFRYCYTTPNNHPLVCECRRDQPSQQILTYLLDIGVNMRVLHSSVHWNWVLNNPIVRKWHETRKLSLLFVGGEKRIESPLRMLSNDLLEMIALELKVR